MFLMKPDYDRSLLSLVCSALAYYGAEPGHATLACFDELLQKNYRNVVVMLFDGMGPSALKTHLPADAFLRRHLRGALSSVFPPTTTAAVTTMQSGLSPIEHGWLGWSLYFGEIGANVDIFPNTLSQGEGVPAAAYNVAGTYLPYESVFEKIGRATGGAVRAENVSAFSKYRTQSLTQICDTVKALCAAEGRAYIYTYWHQPDADMHEYGTLHERAKADIHEIDAAVEALCGVLSDTLVIVTADHGLVDTGWRFIADYPALAACLEKLPSIEPRAASLFVKPGMQARFEETFLAAFGEDFQLYTRARALEEGLFGSGTPHPRSIGFIGDYLAVARGNASLAFAPAYGKLRAAHAGMTAQEMEVPFIAVEIGRKS